MLGSILIPLLLAGLQLAINAPGLIFGKKKVEGKWRQFNYSVCTFVLTPLHTTLFYFNQYYIELKIKKHPTNEELPLERDLLKYHLYRFMKLELGLEAILQIFGQIIFLLIITTETATTEVYGLDTGLSYFLYLSLTWSFCSCIMAHIKGISACREQFKISSKIIVAIYITFALTTRLLSIVMYFTPCLGLMSLLRHWQAEQTPWNYALVRYFVNNGSIQIGNSPLINWAQLDRWNRTESASPPPPLTLYTLMSRSDYVFMFFGILVAHLFLTYIMKMRYSNGFKSSNVVNRIIHVIESTNIPMNYKEWDDGFGDADEHMLRKKSNLKDVWLQVSLNWFFNTMLLTPLCVLCE